MTSGFYATEKGGTVTKVDNDDPRTILEIDGRPAGEVYTEWTEGSLVKGLTYDDDGVATILAPSSFMPLGERIDKNIETVRLRLKSKKYTDGSVSETINLSPTTAERIADKGSNGSGARGESCESSGGGGGGGGGDGDDGGGSKDYFRVLHPASLNRETSALTSFADAYEGMDLKMLSGSSEVRLHLVVTSTQYIV